ncbi:MAG TPA: rod shape-determining protein RodA [Candidatus Paceibacterota bacterium]
MPRMRERVGSVDWIMLLATLPILGAGFITMYSFRGASYFAGRQPIWILVALLVCFVASNIDWRFLRRTSVVVLFYSLAVLVLFALFGVGAVSHGAQSWLSFGLFAVQPADLVKIVLIITLAKYFSRRHIEIANWKHIIVSGVYALVVFLLVTIQPDFGSAMILFMIWFGMVLVSGIPWKHLLIVFGFGIVAVSMLWLFAFAPYQKDRILTFLDPARDIRGSGYNAFQSVVAVGSGTLTGKGVGYGTQSRLSYLPEYQSDFIFAAFAEEWGFIGALFLFIFYGMVIWRVLASALRGATNFETLFALGVAIFISSHVLVNIGMNIGVLPVTGITLPFMSYGGSHLITEFLALGMVMAMSRYGRSVHPSDASNEFLGPT